MAGERRRVAAGLVAGSPAPAMAVACGNPGAGEVSANPPGNGNAGGATAEGAVEGPFELPFGLEPIDGTEPVGRPAIYDHVPFTFDGNPVEARSFEAAYRVTSDDPLGVLRAWVAQLGNGLALDEASIHSAGEDHSPWMEAWASQEYRPDRPGGDYASLQLWVTGADPILLVSMSRTSDEPPRAPTVEADDAGDPPPPASVVDDTPRAEGDVLFTEQGDEVHLPEGTRSLMPTIPTFGGTGGSTSVLAATDGEAAVQALLDEAAAYDDHAEVTGPETSTFEGNEVVTGNFVITAGGWSFDVVSIRAPDDPHATVYVTSAAD